MHSFIVHLIANGLTRKTIRRHIDNLWLLGGEIIRHVNNYEEYHAPPIEKPKESFGSDGGPYCRHIDSETALISLGEEDIRAGRVKTQEETFRTVRKS
jgi:hypothetical protein